MLASFGARDEDVERLLEHNRCIARRGGVDSPPDLPLGDEPHLEAWREYADEARQGAVFETLRSRLVQLRFPIEEGISATAAYRSATRQGRPPLTAAALELTAPDELELAICETVGGSVPILIPGNRSDFVTLVQALTRRNEPDPIPGSMGACMVKGLVNWDRVERYRRAWESSRGGEGSSRGWAEEFRMLASRKELYQDRFIILSRGPYSAVAARTVGLEADDWLRRSLSVRRAHESFHYLTLRVFGTMMNTPLDEVVADLAGIVEAFGSYRPDLALLFLGLEAFPAYRSGGRLENYWGEPPLSRSARQVEAALVHAAVRNLERLWRELPRTDDGPSGDHEALLVALCSLSLEELATTDLGSAVSSSLGSHG